MAGDVCDDSGGGKDGGEAAGEEEDEDEEGRGEDAEGGEGEDDGEDEERAVDGLRFCVECMGGAAAAGTDRWGRGGLTVVVNGRRREEEEEGGGGEMDAHSDRRPCSDTTRCGESEYQREGCCSEGCALGNVYRLGRRWALRTSLPLVPMALAAERIICVKRLQVAATRGANHWRLNASSERRMW